MRADVVDLDNTDAEGAAANAGFRSLRGLPEVEALLERMSKGVPSRLS